MEKNDISTRLTELRQFLGLNQTKFAQQIEIPRTTLIGYEAGNTVPAEVITKICTKFSVNLEWLMLGKGVPNTLSITGTTAEKATNIAIKQIAKEQKEKEAEKSILEQAIEKMIEEKTEERFTKVEENLEEIKKVIRKVTVRTMGGDGTVYESLEERDEDNNTINKKHIKSSKPLYPGVVPADDVFGVEEPSVAYGKEIELPLIENLAAGIPVESYHDHETFAVSASLVKEKKEDYCVAKISGTSMKDIDIPDGSFVLLKHCTEPQNGAISVVQYEYSTTLKLLHQKQDGSWELKYCDGTGAKIELKDGTWEVKARYITTLKK